MAEKRKDNKGRILKDNEYQQTDGRYFFCYYDMSGKRCREYSWKLVSTDRVPTGKRDCVSLREKEKEITKDKFKGIDTAKSKKLTLNDIFDRYINSKIELKSSTKNNYLYMYQTYVKNTIGTKKIADIKYSDIKSLSKSPDTKCLTITSHISISEAKSISSVYLSIATFSKFNNLSLLKLAFIIYSPKPH